MREAVSVRLLLLLLISSFVTRLANSLCFSVTTSTPKSVIVSETWGTEAGLWCVHLPKQVHIFFSFATNWFSRSVETVCSYSFMIMH